MKQNEKGMGLIEVIIAIFVSTVVIAGVAAFSVNAIAVSLYSKNKSSASKYAQEAIEWLKGEKEKDTKVFLTTIALNDARYCISQLNFSKSGYCSQAENQDLISGTIYKREVFFTTQILGSSTLASVTVKVFWDDGKGRHESILSTDFADTR